MSTRRVVGVFGGSFSPPHLGHMMAVHYGLLVHPIDVALVVPCFVHPYGKALLPFEHRVAMLRAGLMHLGDHAVVSTIEEELGGVSYTVNLIEALRTTHPDWDFRLMIGSDLVDDIPNWYRSSDLVRLAPPLEIPRGGHATGPAIPQISSTEVRERWAAGQSLEGLVPRGVLQYLAKLAESRKSDKSDMSDSSDTAPVSAD